jgi:hypothetical protein
MIFLLICIWGPGPLYLGNDMFLVGPKVFRFVVKGSKSYFEGVKRVGVTIESYGKLEISYINVDNF